MQIVSRIFHFWRISQFLCNGECVECLILVGLSDLEFFKFLKTYTFLQQLGL